MDQHTAKTACVSSNNSFVSDDSSGRFVNDIRRTAVVQWAGLVTTGCSSRSVKAALMGSVTSASEGWASEDDGFYHSPRSRGFNDLTGR
jgi:hypothetical protein